MNTRQPQKTGTQAHKDLPIVSPRALRAGCCVSALLLLHTLGAPFASAAERDPFWPIGYQPAPPAPVEVPKPTIVEPLPAAVAEPPPKPAPPAIKAIETNDWETARKTLSVSGFASSTRPDTGETRLQVMINRKTYSAGDFINITNRNIHFTWRIENASERELKLQPVTATRLPADKPSNLKQ